jgi:dihydropteroate synthase
VVADVAEFFQERFRTLVASGMDPAALCFDPGIGFGKTLEHNLALLRGLGELSIAGRPLLLGVSRKSFLGRILETDDLNAREWPTVAITASAREKGVMLHRVHSVRPNVEALRMTEAILGIPANRG